MERSAEVVRRVPLAISKSTVIGGALFVVALVLLLFIQVAKLGMVREAASRKHEHAHEPVLTTEVTGETAVRPTPTSTPRPPSSPAQKKRAEELYAKLLQANVYNRAQYALQLRDLGTAGMEKLTEALDSDRPEIRRVAASVLSFCQFKPSLEKLRQLALSDPSQEVRENAAYALGRCDDQRAFPVLERALRDKSIYVRRSAARALATLAERGYGAKRLLLDALKSDDAQVRRQAALGLLALRDPSLTDTLIAALSDPDDHVRATAARALGLLKAREAAPRLMKMIDVVGRERDSSWLARSRAAEALGAIFEGQAKSGDQLVADVGIKLDQAMNMDEEPVVRHFAGKALQKIGFYTSKITS